MTMLPFDRMLQTAERVLFYLARSKTALIMTKPFCFLMLVLVTSFAAQAQSFRKADKSPMDLAYFPDNFAHDRKAGEAAIVRVMYSRPAKNDRELFGKLVPYNEVWRAGANEATEVKLYRDITVGGKKLSAGTYSLFVLPTEKEWTVIFNSDLDYWGAYSYNKAHDVLRATASVGEAKASVENFVIQFEKKGDHDGVMRMAWGTTVAELPFSY